MIEFPDVAVRRGVAEILAALDARAAGYWRVEGDQLIQVAFTACPALNAEVSRTFAEATRMIALSHTNLGVVKAAVTGCVAVSRAGELPAESGSGYWLRAFGASRSVAVPLQDRGGAICAVLSVALPDRADSDDAIAQRLREAARTWPLPS
jgi:hypothetical protein